MYLADLCGNPPRQQLSLSLGPRQAVVNMLHWTFPRFLLLTLSTLHFCNGQFVVVAPNLIRVDSDEKIFVQATGVTDTIQVTVTIRDFKTDTRQLFEGYTSLSVANKHHTLVPIRLPSSTNIRRNDKEKQYVNLEVRFGNLHTEKRAMLVSFQAGYIFIQTDKPIYRPGETVRIRAYAASTSFKASASNGVALDIKNSDGVIVELKKTKIPYNGILPESYTIPEIVNEGKWTIIAKFDHWPQNNFNTTFEVKKYVLPAFNLTVTPTKPYLNVDDTQVIVDISARYLYGEPVIGTAYVVYGLKNGQKIMRAPKVKQMKLEGNKETLILTMDEIKQACEVQSGSVKSDCSVTSLVDKYVYLKVTVLTASGGDLVEVELSNIKIVNSPYVLELKDMQKYFKPGLPLYFAIHVTHHDGSPVHNINLRVNLHDQPLTSHYGIAAVSINMPKEISPQTIIVTTDKTDLSAEKQAKIQVTVDPYRPARPWQPNYLFIDSKAQEIKMRELSLVLNIKSESSIQEVTYLVLSKGKILDARRVPVSEHLITSVTITVTSDMMPTFRFVAFYTIGNEVVSDSVKLRVSETCVHPPVISAVDTMPIAYRPGKPLKLKIEGEPRAKISLVAVDQAVYLLSKRRFNQRHILNEVDSRDMGCTHGSGKNAMGVFSDAGLLFAMKNGPSTDSRQELKCSDHMRRRRSVLMEQQAQLLEQFQEKLLRRCCRDGLRRVLMPYSCEQRASYITEEPECVKTFLKCCNVYKKQVDSQSSDSQDSQDLGRSRGSGSAFDASDSDSKALGASGESEDEEDEDEDEDLYMRKKLEDSWLWLDKNMPDQTNNEGVATLHHTDAIPDSITQWSVLAVSSSVETGFCVGEPWTFVVMTPFFVDLKLPFSVARNEQVEIKAVVYNYLDDPLDVKVVLGKTRDMCSVAFKRANTQRIRVQPKSSKVVPYTIVPLKAGKLPIEVSAYVKNMHNDGITKTLNVVMEGVQTAESNIILLEPAAHKGRQVVRTIKPVLKGVVVPNSEPQTKIKLSGDVLAESIENAIHDDPLARLIRMPGGCVEQNLAAVTFPVIAALYLDRTNGWETVAIQRKIDADQYIKKGISNQLNFKRSDGSYPPYAKHGPSTWVTAYVMKIFTMAFDLYTQRRQHLDMDTNEICDPLEFLLKHTQSQDGKFLENNPVSNQFMTGGLRGSDSEATLTAFVSIALAEFKESNIDCGTNIQSSLQSALAKAVPYLKGQLLRSPPPRPYTTAIISYALALLTNGGYNPTDSLLAKSEGGTYWPDSDSLFKLEATGYALLTLVKMGRLTEAKKPFDFLRENRNINGASGNTQSTMVVLLALSKYLISQPPPVTANLNVNFQIGARSESLIFIPATSSQTRSFNVQKNADFEVVAEGTGVGTLEVVTYYNQLPNSRSCETFEMQVSIQKSKERPETIPGIINIFELSISVKALGPVPAVSVVLDISLPTGFTAETRDLENLLNTVEKFIDHFYFDTKLSDRNSMIIHMYQVSNTWPQTVTFRLLQQFNVGLLQPSSVTVYEFYKEKGQRCTQLYSLPQDQIDLTTICTNNNCVCAQDDCCQVKEGTIQDKERETFACETLHHVFKVKVLNISREYNNIYEMEITKVIKMGVESGVVESDRRLFFSHSGCRDTCVLQKGSQYLIIGPERDTWSRDPATNKITYVLGDNTWVELWPTEDQCKNPAHEAKCKSLTKATDFLSDEGCSAKK
ncbi:hypothetical protein NL108_012536 [Boleophthalmus pectinirostris]|uniref:complement C3-like n=1 Tax=Boleophthalmus pectinirostris TaxID=150288 RepID=UPI00242E7824|nr:complement C3-like [Boleophthalmus pectinirostris]KAJ0063846.1 hypothetical protein NL108_012536 [Boleophthalmus pectinirostris]